MMLKLVSITFPACLALIMYPEKMQSFDGILGKDSIIELSVFIQTSNTYSILKTIDTRRFALFKKVDKYGIPEVAELNNGKFEFSDHSG